MKTRSDEEEREGREKGVGGGRMRAVTHGMTQCSCSLSLWSLRCKTITKALSLSLSTRLLLAFLSLLLTLSLSAEWCLVEIMLSICVQCALQVFNITPFTQSNEAMQSYGAVEKSSLYTSTLIVHIAQNIYSEFIVGSSDPLGHKCMRIGV